MSRKGHVQADEEPKDKKNRKAEFCLKEQRCWINWREEWRKMNTRSVEVF